VTPEIVILIQSGKGGSGKTTIAAEIGKRLSKYVSVGMIDADIRAPNLLHELGYDENNSEMGVVGQKFIPIKVGDIEVLSASSFFDETVGIEWGSDEMAQFLSMIYDNLLWSNNRVLIIDTEPSDVAALDWATKKFGHRLYSVVVTTTDEKSISNCRRIIDTNKRKNVRQIGIIGNMVGNVCPHCGSELKCAVCGEPIGNSVAVDVGKIKEFANEVNLRCVATVPKSEGNILYGDDIDELVESIVYKIDNWLKTEFAKKITGVAKWMEKKVRENNRL